MKLIVELRQFCPRLFCENIKHLGSIFIKESGARTNILWSSKRAIFLDLHPGDDPLNLDLEELPETPCQSFPFAMLPPLCQNKGQKGAGNATQHSANNAGPRVAADRGHLSLYPWRMAPIRAAASCESDGTTWL